MDGKYFGFSMRYYRKQKSWSQEQLAEKLGVSTRMVQKYESGELPSLEIALLSAEVFHTSVENLFGIEEKMDCSLKAHISNMSSTDREKVQKFIKVVAEML